ncbi:50S ribosomal protein L1 [Babesia ovata]|uniref:50S ribosomal protein L1 n=1 Tax=Babesia ovata TaxID=189622 RepID=A0A2H6KAU9_9APIC|nr:50S ribosomal protein L1 [Babesia ovata]GBE60122.1 50S ribosomal protein L1 [Babesia ovata]
MGRGVTWAYLYFILLVKSLLVRTYTRIPGKHTLSESFIHCFGSCGGELRQRDVEPGFRTASGYRYRSFRSNASNKGGAKGSKKTVISGTAAERQALIDRSLELGISQDDIDDYLKQYKVVKNRRPTAASKQESTPVSPATADKEASKTAGSPVEQPKKRKLPKRLLEKSEYLPERGVEYPLYEAIDRIKLISGVRFVEGIDVALHVPLSRKKVRATAAQYARLITIPHQSLKSRRCRIGVFAKPAICEQVRALNATKVLFVGGAELIEQFKAEDSYPDVDFVLSDLDTFHKLSAIGRALGRRGLMPSLTVGTCIQHTADLLDTVDKVENRNTFILRSDRVGDIKCNFADVTMPREEIRENLLEIVKYLRQNKPDFAGAQILSAAYVSSSMGPSFRIFLKDLGFRGRVKRGR